MGVVDGVLQVGLVTPNRSVGARYQSALLAGDGGLDVMRVAVQPPHDDCPQPKHDCELYSKHGREPPDGEQHNRRESADRGEADENTKRHSLLLRSEPVATLVLLRVSILPLHPDLLVRRCLRHEQHQAHTGHSVLIPFDTGSLHSSSGSQPIRILLPLLRTGL